MNRKKDITTIKYSYPENVSIAGTFTDWKPKLMVFDRSNNENYIEVGNKDLQTLVFKFIVGQEWKTSDRYSTVRDASGNLNNTIDLKEGSETAESDNLLSKSSFGSSTSYKSLTNTTERDKNRAFTKENDASCARPASASSESFLTRIWLWIKALFFALF